MRIDIWGVVLVFGLLLVPACGTEPGGDDGGVTDSGGATDGGGGGALTWSQVQSEVISGCTAALCHGAGNQNGVIELGDANAYAMLVGAASSEVPTMNYIEPGDPQTSYLYRKLEGTQVSACSEAGLNTMQCGEQMPRGRPALSADLREGLRLWIVGGALEN